MKTTIILAIILFSSSALASNRVDCPASTNWFARVSTNDWDTGASAQGSFSWSAANADAYFATDPNLGYYTPTCTVSGSNFYSVWGYGLPPGSQCDANATLYVEDITQDQYGLPWKGYDWGHGNVPTTYYRLDYGYAVFCNYTARADTRVYRSVACVTEPACSSRFVCAVEDGYVTSPPPAHATNHYFLDYHKLNGCNGGSL
jgi:hypothetical protein